MKLAEALSCRAALADKVRQLEPRLNDCLKVQEGDVPIETPEQVVAELDGASRRVAAIDLCNQHHQHKH